jgi:hypothetical protein
MLKLLIFTLIFIHVCHGEEFFTSTVTVPLIDCVEGMVLDGNGGCIFKTTMIPETTMIKTTYHYDDECKKVFGHRFRRCEFTTSTLIMITTTTPITSIPYTCPWYSKSDGKGGCYLNDDCTEINVNGRIIRPFSVEVYDSYISTLRKNDVT